jgi:hypothetical protein
LARVIRQRTRLKLKVKQLVSKITDELPEGICLDGKLTHRLTEDICPNTKKEQDITSPAIEELSYVNPVSGFGFWGGGSTT